MRTISTSNGCRSFRSVECGLRPSERAFLTDCRSIAATQCFSIERHLAFSHMSPRMASGPKRMCDAIARVELGQPEVGCLMAIEPSRPVLLVIRCSFPHRFISRSRQRPGYSPRMELRHLRYFIAVAEEENVSRAALKLHVSQPALSRQIRDLENELGFLLLERSAKSVRLTEAGRAFLIEARAVLQRAEDAVKAARTIARGGAGELHVGYAPSLTARILPQTLRAFQAESATVRVKLHDLSTEEMLAGLREGKLQMAFVLRLTPAMLRGLRFEELFRDSICLAV